MERTIVATVKLAMGNIDRPGQPSQQWLRALHEDQPAELRRSIAFARTTLVFHVAVLGLSVATGLWVLPLIFSLASFMANWLAYFVGMTQHCGLRDNVPDFRKCVRSVRLDPLSEFLYWRMNWHAEHHMYAGVPCYNLKALSRELAADMPPPKTLFGAWKEMLETWRRQQIDPDYQYDVPLPPTSGRFDTDRDTALATSIGDLAPRGLK